MDHRATVTNLVLNFGDACRALVPSLDRARVPWSDANQYDNWDRIAEALFESLVGEPCKFQAAEIGLDGLHLRRYDFDTDPAANAFISVVTPNCTDCRLISLVSQDQPFSHVRAVGKSGETVAPIEQCDFAFVMIDHTGKTHQFTEIDLEL
jgi:hypothetical protein